MITFVDLTFSPSGERAAVVVAKLQAIRGVTSVMGEHDAMFHWKTDSEFDERMEAIHKALGDTGATYRVFTVEDSYQSKDPVPWIGPLDGEPSRHPALSKEK
jgi:hypothetical protein